jgi:hypothetical protein
MNTQPCLLSLPSASCPADANIEVKHLDPKLCFLHQGGDNSSRLKAFFNGIKLRSKWRQELLRGHKDDAPVDAEVGDSSCQVSGVGWSCCLQAMPAARAQHTKLCLLHTQGLLKPPFTAVQPDANYTTLLRCLCRCSSTCPPPPPCQRPS